MPQFVIYRCSINWRWWTVYKITEKYGRCLVPHQTGFRTKREATEYMNRVLSHHNSGE